MIIWGELESTESDGKLTKSKCWEKITQERGIWDILLKIVENKISRNGRRNFFTLCFKKMQFILKLLKYTICKCRCEISLCEVDFPLGTRN